MYDEMNTYTRLWSSVYVIISANVVSLRAIIGLSGGIDSALTACLAHDCPRQRKCPGSSYAFDVFIGRQCG